MRGDWGKQRAGEAQLHQGLDLDIQILDSEGVEENDREFYLRS